MVLRLFLILCGWLIVGALKPALLAEEQIVDLPLSSSSFSGSCSTAACAHSSFQRSVLSFIIPRSVCDTNIAVCRTNLKRRL